MKKWKKCPLLIAVVMTGFLCSLLGMFKLTGNTEHGMRDWPSTPALAVVFQGMGNQTLPLQKPGRLKDSKGQPARNTESVLQTEEAVTEAQTEDTKTFDFTTVDQSYFDDAVFIGDSRTVGLHDYSGWDNATYYASIGLTVYDMFGTPIVQDDGSEITVEQALKEYSFGKVYLMIGINEMGTGTVDSFMEAYQKAVSHLQELQPNAIIFVEGIMYVKQEKSESDPIFNNPNIKERNDRIAKLADNRNIFYIDVNEVVTDETGNLNPAYTYDEVHLLGKYYSVWTDFLLKHGIVKE